uniref:NTF2-related export protein n=2 Tax=Meloidogyne incognita group TaxID=654580 RepID=A0A915NBT5_MELJA
MSSSISSKVKLDQEVCADADKLVRLYTELADLRRNKIINLYSSNGPQLIWNGNCYSGLTEIGSFWDNLPSTQHEVICLDAHRIDPTSDDMSIVVLSMGKVTIGGLTHAYNQSLVLILEEGTYKVKSDTYRLMD